MFAELPAEQQDTIRRYLSYVIDANKVVNLTRIDTPEDGLILHVEDSLAGLPEVMDAPEGWYGDLGSGGGFPGVPLAVASGRSTVLIDSRQKKMDVVQGVLEELGLDSQISTYAGRAELLAREQPESFAVLTARALSKLSVLLELASPLLERGGRIVCYKAQVDEAELNHALKVAKMTGMKLVLQREFMLEDEFKRSIIVFEKTSRPKVKLPRQEGMAQKKPL